MAAAGQPLSEVIELGHTPAFRLGPLTVDPSTRQISHAGHVECLEPRVMQVLVALVRAEGAVVSRGDLVASCWGGLAVGDNAIHRAISRLREIAASLGGAVFTIETIARVGYRLHLSGARAAEDKHPSALRSMAAALGRRPRALAAALMICAVGTAIGLWRAYALPASPTVVVQAGRDAGAAALAGSIRSALPELMGERDVSVSVADRGDFTARVTARGPAPDGATDLTLLDRHGAEIWSADFRRTAAGAALGPWMANRLAAALSCAIDARRDGAALEAASLRIFVAACEAMPDHLDETTVVLLRTVTQRSPAFATGWAWLAYAENELSRTRRYQGVDYAALSRIADAHLARAEALGVRPGFPALVRAMATPPGQWRRKLALIDQGIDADPAFVPLHLLRSRDYGVVGRESDSIEAARTAVALEPANPRAREILIYALQFGGRTELARSELESAEAAWPGSAAIRRARIHFDIRFGDPSRLIRSLDSGAVDESGEVGLYLGPLRTLLAARADPTATNVGAVVRIATHSRERGSIWRLQALAQFGSVDDAYKMLNDPRLMEAVGDDPSILFRPNTRALRNDPRFMKLAARLGLARYWIETGRWPDFCDDPDLPYSCRVEAARAQQGLAAAANPRPTV